MKMSRVITEPSHCILTTTSSKISRVVLILLSMSLFLNGKTVGAEIVSEALEFDGKGYSSIPADQTTDWQWSTSASAFDGNLLFKTNNWIFDGQADQAYPLISIPLDRLTVDKLFTQDPTSFESSTSLDNPWVLLLLLVMLGVGLVLGKALTKQEKSAHRRKHRMSRRRISIGSAMARIRAEKSKNSDSIPAESPPS